MTIGFWGAGRMGSPVAVNLLRHGHTVLVYSRDIARARAVAAAGERGLATDHREDLASCAVLCTCVAVPRALEEALLGERGLYASMRPGALHIEFSTIAPGLGERLQAAAAARGIGYVQAPLGKTPEHAARAEEAIWAGGADADVKRAMPLLAQVGIPLRMASVSAACTFKILSNLIGMSNMAILAEAMRVGIAAGVEPGLLLRLLSGTGADSYQMAVRGPKIASGDHTPLADISLCAKDMGLGMDMVGTLGLDTPIMAAARAAFVRAMANGLGDRDPSALALLGNTEARPSS